MEEIEVLGDEQAADLAELQAMASGGAPMVAGPVDEGPDKASQVEAMLRPAFALASAGSPKLAAFYTPEKVREISVVFVGLSEQEGWDLAGLQSKWGLRITFVLVATPPHAIEWVMGKLVAFAVGKRIKDKGEGQSPEQEGAGVVDGGQA